LEKEIEGFFKIKPVKSVSALDMGQIEQVIGKNILLTMADSRVLEAIPGGFALLRHSNR